MKNSFSFSSSTHSSFDGNFELGSPRNATTGCLSGIIRRLLCSGSLPTYPCDQIKDVHFMDLVQPQNSKTEKIEAPATPGLVARLMGLESLPELNWVPPVKTLDSFGRSRSVNSADYWSGFDPVQGRHRRVRTSLSFRESPTFIQLENDDFFLLSFENLKGKSENSFDDLRQRRKVVANKNKESRRQTMLENKNKKKNKEVEGSKKKAYKEDDKKMKKINGKLQRKPSNGNSSRISDSGLSPQNKEIRRKSVHVSKTSSPTKSKNYTEVTERAVPPKKKQSLSPAKKIKPECDTPNTSPVSVLDLGDYLIEPRTPLSEEKLKPRGSNLRRKLSPELLEADDYPSAPIFHNSISENRESRGHDRKERESEKALCHTQECVEQWGEIYKLAEEELMGSNWISKEISNLVEFEEIGIEFGLQIVDQLLNEITDELHGFPSRIPKVMKLKSCNNLYK